MILKSLRNGPNTKRCYYIRKHNDIKEEENNRIKRTILILCPYKLLSILLSIALLRHH